MELCAQHDFWLPVHLRDAVCQICVLTVPFQMPEPRKHDSRFLLLISYSRILCAASEVGVIVLRALGVWLLGQSRLGCILPDSSPLLGSSCLFKVLQLSDLLTRAGSPDVSQRMVRVQPWSCLRP